MEICIWTNLNLKHNLLKHTDTENIGDLDNKEKCLYIYFSVGNDYDLSKLVLEKKPFTVAVLPASYPYIQYPLVHIQINSL